MLTEERQTKKLKYDKGKEADLGRWRQTNYLCNLMKENEPTNVNEEEHGCKLVFYSADLSTELGLPYAAQGIRAGFPSPAQDYMTESIDLNKELVQHPATTFYARAVGD